MDKRLVYPQYNVRGDRDVFSVTEDRKWLQKTAGAYHPAIQKYIDNAKPLPGLIQVLLTALGAYEYWGQNVNADRFYEGALKHDGPDYGYKTFLTNANYFTHHVNKDPALAKGNVLETVWNDKAKRVELVVGINPALDPDAASMLDNGEALCFSMGARLPFDVCTACGNKARTRAEYCDHLKYQLGQIDPVTGILVGAINPTPKFFDISRVLIPADKTAYMWEKIAHTASNPLAKLGSAQLASMTIKQAVSYEPEIRKVASVQKKTAEITKRIVAVSHPKAVEKLREALAQVKTALDKNASEIPSEVFRVAPDFNSCINSMAFLGLVPTPRERDSLVDIFTGKDGLGPEFKVGPGYINIAFIKRILPYAEARSMYRPALLRQVSTIEKTSTIVGDTASTAATVGKNITSAVFSAIGAIFGITGSLAPKVKAIDAMPNSLAGIIAKHPVLAGLLAAIAVKNMGSPSRQLTSGNFTVADPTRGTYNNDWLRRFELMQNRPAAVIKTGAALESVGYLSSPLSYLTASVDLPTTPEEKSIWDVAADQFLSQINSESFGKLIKSADILSSSGECVGDSVPEFMDIEILKIVTGMNRK